MRCPTCSTPVRVPEDGSPFHFQCPRCARDLTAISYPEVIPAEPPEEGRARRPGRRRRDLRPEGPRFRCPYCRSTREPIRGRKVSLAGWILFLVLMGSCVGLLVCWIGLLLTEEYTVCDDCGVSVGGVV
jgi:hypothetical protein